MEKLDLITNLLGPDHSLKVGLALSSSDKPICLLCSLLISEERGQHVCDLKRNLFYLNLFDKHYKDNDKLSICTNCSETVSNFLKVLKEFYKVKNNLRENFFLLQKSLINTQLKLLEEGEHISNLITSISDWSKKEINNLCKFENFDEAVLRNDKKSKDDQLGQKIGEKLRKKRRKIHIEKTVTNTIKSNIDNISEGDDKSSCEFECNKCDKKCQSQNALKVHKKSHIGDSAESDGTYKCSHCPSVFENLANLELHKKVEHELPLNFCSICEKQLSKRSLQQHLVFHSKSFTGKIVCQICTKSISTPLLLSLHMDVHKGNFTCHATTCRKSFKTSKARELHVQEVHEQEGIKIKECCNYCPAVFEDMEELSCHTLNHELEVERKKYLCEQCGTSYLTKQSLTQHKRKTHFKAATIHKCIICEKSFGKVSNLKAHILTHQDEGPFYCSEPNCKKSFSQKASLENHVMVHHKGQIPMRYICPYCLNLGFTNKQGRRTHIFKHHFEDLCETGKCICPVCYMNFVTDEELKIHSEKHEKLICKICDIQCKTLGHLKEHTLRHASFSQRPFICPHCPSKGFVREKQLLVHLNTKHMDELSNYLSEKVTYVINVINNN